MSRSYKRTPKLKFKVATKRTASSGNWLKRNLGDIYIAMAKEQKYRSRAAFKLLQIDEKFKIFKGSKHIIDFGCAPGSWLQVIKEKTKRAKVVGVDLQYVKPISNIEILQGDINNKDLIKKLSLTFPQKVDLVLSDMSASASGDKSLDHIRNITLVEAALDFAKNNLKTGGNFVAKILRGKEEANLLKKLKISFETIKQFKPDASYSDSSEIYYICLGYLT